MANTNETKLNVGMVVRSKVAVVDEDEHGSFYFHAAPGDFGIITDCDEPETWPNIRWLNGGTCHMPPEDVEVYQGRVSYVCGQPAGIDASKG